MSTAKVTPWTKSGLPAHADAELRPQVLALNGDAPATMGKSYAGGSGTKEEALVALKAGLKTAAGVLRGLIIDIEEQRPGFPYRVDGQVTIAGAGNVTEAVYLAEWELRDSKWTLRLRKLFDAVHTRGSTNAYDAPTAGGSPANHRYAQSTAVTAADPNSATGRGGATPGVLIDGGWSAYNIGPCSFVVRVLAQSGAGATAVELTHGLWI